MKFHLSSNGFHLGEHRFYEGEKIFTRVEHFTQVETEEKVTNIKKKENAWYGPSNYLALQEHCTSRLFYWCYSHYGCSDFFPGGIHRGGNLSVVFEFHWHVQIPSHVFCRKVWVKKTLSRTALLSWYSYCVICNQAFISTFLVGSNTNYSENIWCWGGKMWTRLVDPSTDSLC